MRKVGLSASSSYAPNFANLFFEFIRGSLLFILLLLRGQNELPALTWQKQGFLNHSGRKFRPGRLPCVSLEDFFTILMKMTD